MVAVGMLSNLFPPVASGSSTQCSGLARALVERGHEVVALTARLHPGAPAHEGGHGGQGHRLPCLHLPRTDLSLNFPWLNATLSPGNLRQIAALLDRYRVEVVHVHNHMFDLALAGAVLARRTGRKLVVTVHTIIKHRRPLYDLLLGTADRLLLKRTVIDAAQGLLCPATSTATCAHGSGVKTAVSCPTAWTCPPRSTRSWWRTCAGSTSLRGGG